MSIKVMNAVFDTSLPPSEKIVAIKLADHAHDDGTSVYPSAASLASKCSLSERQVRRILKILLVKGVIVQDRSGGGRATNLYHFSLDEEGKITPASSDKLSPLDSACDVVDVMAPLTSETRSSDMGDRGTIITINEQSPSSRQNDYPTPFLEFWKAYPRHKEKDGAYKVWKRLVEKELVDPADLTTASIRYASECERSGTEQRFIKLGATFLGPKGSWKDYLPEEVDSAKLHQAIEWDRYDESFRNGESFSPPAFPRPTDSEGNFLDWEGRAYYIDPMQPTKRRYLDDE